MTFTQSTIRSIFLYLDRSYLFSSPAHKSIEATGVELFRTYIAEDKALETSLLNGVFALFGQDRQSGGRESINSTLLSSCVRMISSLGLYSARFEPRLIESAREYYMQLAKSESRVNGTTAYINECVDQIEKEVIRCDTYHLEHSTKRELIAALEDEMVRKKIDLLTEKQRIRELLERGDDDTLAKLYQLLERAGNAGDLLKASWEIYIIEEGKKIIADKEKEVEMVPRLLDYKGTLDATWVGPLKKNPTLGYSLRESFSAFINARRDDIRGTDSSKPAEMIAKYVDLLLRQGAKGLPPVAGAEGTSQATNTDDDAALAYRLELVLDLFRFIQGKDVFEAFYKKDLARRLLLGRSASVDAERLMLAKLKTGTGLHPTTGYKLTTPTPRMRSRIYGQPRSHVPRHGPLQGLPGLIQDLQGRHRDCKRRRSPRDGARDGSMALLPRGPRQHPAENRSTLGRIPPVLCLEAQGQEALLAPRPLPLRPKGRLYKGLFVILLGVCGDSNTWVGAEGSSPERFPGHRASRLQ